MVRLATIILSVLLVSACSNSDATPAAAAPESTPAAASTAPASPAEPVAASQPAESPAAPSSNSALSFKAYGGRDVAIEDYKGKVVMVLFLSTDCPHCQTTARILAPIYRQYQAKGVQWYSFAKISMMKTPYVPHAVFVGKDGKVAENHPGDDTAFWQDQGTNVAAALDRLLAQ